MPKLRLLLVPFLTVALPSTAAFAAVSLKLTDASDGDGSVTVTRGATSTFKMVLSMTSTESTVSVDYNLTDLNFVGTGMEITGRDLTGSSFTSQTSDDSTALASPSRILNGVNDSGLGASISNVNTPLVAGNYTIVTYTITVPGGVPLGVHTLVTSNSSGTQVGAPTNPTYAFSGPNPFTPTAFASGGTISVNVVPEPASLGLLGVGAIGLLHRRRRNA